MKRFTALRDPGIQVVLVLVALFVAGFAMLAWGWHGVAGTPYVPFQLPWLLSASIGGLGVIGFALGAWSIHLARRQDAAHRAVTEDVVRDVAELAESLRSSGRLNESRRR